MSAQKERESFKRKVLESFKDKGLLDKFKSQISASLADKRSTSENQKASSTNKENISPVKDKDTVRPVIISLISDYLEKTGLHYTNSIFVPEAKAQGQVLSRAEILENINFKSIFSIKEDKPIIQSLIEYMEFICRSKEKPPINSSKSELDKSYDSRHSRSKSKDRSIMKDRSILDNSMELNAEERFNQFKRDFELRMRQEIAEEIERIKAFELVNIRIEEAEKARAQNEKLRQELENSYMEKLQKLRDREREALEKLKAQAQLLEQGSQAQTEKFLKEIENQKFLTAEKERLLELEKENLQAERDRVKRLERELNKKIEAIEEEREQIRRELENTRRATKVEMMKEMERDRIQIYNLKTHVEIEADKIHLIKEKAENTEFQNKRLLEENAHLIRQLTEARDAKRVLELELDKKSALIENLEQALAREEEHIRKFEKQIAQYKSEIGDHEASKEEFKNLMERRRKEQIELNQRYIKEIETYQAQVEQVQREKDTLKKRIAELEDEVNQLLKKQKPAPKVGEKGIQIDLMPEAKPKERLDTSFIPSDHRTDSTADFETMKRMSEIERELDILKKKREEEILSYFLEPSESKDLFNPKPSTIMAKSNKINNSFLEHSYNSVTKEEVSRLSREREFLKRDLFNNLYALGHGRTASIDHVLEYNHRQLQQELTEGDFISEDTERKYSVMMSPIEDMKSGPTGRTYDISTSHRKRDKGAESEAL